MRIDDNGVTIISLLHNLSKVSIDKYNDRMYEKRKHWTIEEHIDNMYETEDNGFSTFDFLPKDVEQTKNSIIDVHVASTQTPITDDSVRVALCAKIMGIPVITFTKILAAEGYEAKQVGRYSYISFDIFKRVLYNSIRYNINGSDL